LSNKNPLIYVWSGSVIPKWSIKSLNFTCELNKKRKILLLYDSKKGINIIRNIKSKNFEPIFIKNINKSSPILNSSNLFEGDFWKLTSQRFQILLDFLKKEKILNFFHAELDNLIFNFDDLDNKLDKIGNGIFVPKDSFNRAIASFLYCNRTECLNEIIDIYKPPNNVRNDMEALGIYSNISKYFFSLPTESFLRNSEKWKIIKPEITKGIFDAAAIGQFCLGIDPRNNRYKPTYNLFINENVNVDINKLKFLPDQKIFKIFFPKLKKTYKIYNLHVHSKNIDKAYELLRKKKIYKSLKERKPMIVNHFHKTITGFFIKLIDLILIGLKRIIKISKMIYLKSVKRTMSLIINIIDHLKEYKRRSRLSSFPYISGDTFMAIADCIIIEKDAKIEIIKITNQKDIIFIENDLLTINSVFKIACQFRKVILHNGDKVPDKKLLDKLVKKKIFVFGTNIQDNDQYISPIPIGIENAHHKNHGDLNYYNVLTLNKDKKKKSIISFASFSLNNQIRRNYVSILNDYGIKNNTKLSLDNYRCLLSKSYFVISPPGNGIDCHRTWESFYHRTIPVIEKKYYLFSNFDLPVLIVNKLEEFLKMSDDAKLKKYLEITKVYREQIFMEWWLNYIRSK